LIDCRLLKTAAIAPDPFFKPQELDERCSQSRIACFRHALFAINRTAWLWLRHQPQSALTERHAVSHQAADKVNIAAQSVQLRQSHRAPLTARLTQCGGKLWAPLDCVSALPCLDLPSACHDIPNKS
jgi:hypothetical protein